MCIQKIDLIQQIHSLDNEWQKHCLQTEKQYFLLKKINTFLYKEQKQGKIIFPTNFFRAFLISKFSTIKVVILGQDPYPGEKNGLPQANGLAFSVWNTLNTPPSLNNIFLELKQEYPDLLCNQTILQNELDSWATQGVFLLNTILSVEKMHPGSHRSQGWEIFTDNIIAALAQKRPHLVFLLWGQYAKKKIPIIQSYNKNHRHLILTAPHPSPLSAYQGFFGCNHFKKTNQFLYSKNLSPIKWHSIINKTNDFFQTSPIK